MKKTLIGYALMLSMLLGVTASATGAVNVAKLDLLQQKIADIQTLQVRLADIRQQSLALQSTLQAKVAEYSQEIQQEQKERGLKTFQEALGVYRVRYNLKLVQQINAYLAVLSERIDFFQEGREQIDFLHRQAQDDLKMVQTLSDMEISDFIDQMDQALEKYTRAVDSNLFDIGKIAQPRLESIWDNLKTGK